MKFYKFVIKVLAPIIKLILRVKVVDLRTSKEVPPQTVICANHMSNWDPVITVISTGLPINFMAKESLFRIPVLKNLIQLFGAFPVNRGGADASAIKKSVEILKNGGCFSLFPQGKRMQTPPTPDQAKKGVGFICAKAKAGVLPVGIYTKDYRIKLFKGVTVTIGDVIPFDSIDFGPEGDDYLLASQNVFSVVCDLAKPRDNGNN